MQLPDRPNLRYLRDQAKKLVRSGAAPTLAQAQFQIARQYGFPSWPKLKQHVESLKKTGQLTQAIAANDVARVDALLTANPELRQFLIDDVSLMAVAQPGRIPMMELLVRHGADVNGLRWGWFSVLFTPCENLEPEPLQWLLDHGADPNRGNPNDPGTALDYVIGTYPRDPERLTACIEMLLAAGAHTRYDVPGVLPILRGAPTSSPPLWMPTQRSSIAATPSSIAASPAAACSRFAAQRFSTSPPNTVSSTPPVSFSTEAPRSTPAPTSMPTASAVRLQSSTPRPTSKA